MHQPCKTCPFRENPVEPGAIDWLIDLMEGLKRGSLNHTCHQSDRKADLYAGHKRRRPCVGFLGMMKRFDGSCPSDAAMVAMVRGELDWNKIPTKGVFASPRDCIQFHGKANGIDFEKEVRERAQKQEGSGT